jgi:exopolysaccharide biosynthesis polyprenyl glycosylphosphotransferase
MSPSVHRRDTGWRLRWTLLATGDLLACSLAYLLAFLLRAVVPLPLTQGYLPALRFGEVSHHWIEMLLAQLVTLYFLGLYETRAILSPRQQLGAIAAAAALQALLLIAVYFFRQDLAFPRSIFVVFAVLNALLLGGWRLGCRALMGRYPRRRVVIVGTNAAAAEVIDTIRGQHWLGLDIIGSVVSNQNGTRVKALHDVPVLGTRDELPALCERHNIDEVIIASDATWQDGLLDALSRWPGTRSRVSVVPSPYEILIGRRETLRLHDIPLIEVLDDLSGGARAAVKRGVDLVLGSVLLVPAVPVMLVVAAMIRATSPGPVIFHQARVGQGGRVFTMHKFRTMHAEAERTTGPVLAIENDPRITRLGRILRATRLDELPQLLNVVRGDMSFVGPRPERPEFVSQFERDIQGYAERFRVRPGLTGYAQVNGEYHTSAATKLKYDLAYIHNQSVWLDVRILSETMKVMLTRRGV